MVPETRYARSGDVGIAYQVIGEGGFDLVFIRGWIRISNSNGKARIGE